MSELMFWKVCWLIITACFMVVSLRGLQIHLHRKRIIEVNENLQAHLKDIRDALGLPEEVSLYTLRHCVVRLLEENKRISEKYLDIKTKWQEVDARTAETKKVFARALRRWQQHHKTENVPHLNELVDWLVGDEKPKTEEVIAIEDLARHAEFMVVRCDSLAQNLKRMQYMVDQLKERSV